MKDQDGFVRTTFYLVREVSGREGEILDSYFLKNVVRPSEQQLREVKSNTITDLTMVLKIEKTKKLQ